MPKKFNPEEFHPENDIKLTEEEKRRLKIQELQLEIDRLKKAIFYAEDAERSHWGHIDITPYVPPLKEELLVKLAALNKEKEELEAGK